MAPLQRTFPSECVAVLTAVLNGTIRGERRHKIYDANVKISHNADGPVEAEIQTGQSSRRVNARPTVPLQT